MKINNILKSIRKKFQCKQRRCRINNKNIFGAAIPIKIKERKNNHV